MNIVSKAKLLLPAECDEEMLFFCCEAAEEYIRSYCNLEQIPKGAEALAAQMTADCYKEAVGSGKNVKSITRGDFSVTYGDGAQGSLDRYQKRLNAFRKMKW